MSDKYSVEAVEDRAARIRVLRVFPRDEYRQVVAAVLEELRERVHPNRVGARILGERHLDIIAARWGIE